MKLYKFHQGILLFHSIGVNADFFTMVTGPWQFICTPLPISVILLPSSTASRSLTGIRYTGVLAIPQPFQECSLPGVCLASCFCEVFACEHAVF